MRPDLKTLASAARKEMQDFAKKHNTIGDWEDLGCYCAISSYMLKLLARRFGYKMTLVEGFAFDPRARHPNHCWLEHGDHIYDITATQFAKTKPVHIVNKGNKNYVHRNNMVKQHHFDPWPSEQSPITFQRELSRRAKKIALTFA